MKEKESALFSRYIIDGVQCDTTPCEMLEECMAEAMEFNTKEEEFKDIVDESTDPPLSSFTYSNEENGKYTGMVAEYSGMRHFRMLYPDTFTRQRVAGALIERLWNKGHYRLGDLNLWAEWKWNSRPLGNMSAFYFSAQAASEYIYDLGCRLADFSYDGCDEESTLCVGAWLPERVASEEGDAPEDSAFIKASPYESRHPWIEDERQCPEHLVDDPDSQLIYIPFETASFKLGGSLLAELHGHNGGTGPVIHDPDYFIDCYEVVRELVEDGIVMAGASVGDGGLAKAVAGMCGDTAGNEREGANGTKVGISLNLNGIISSYMEEDTTRILFSEIPGVLIQISNMNMDYLDSQLILQDVAYYPLGSPSGGVKGMTLENKQNLTIANILASLIQ